MITKAGLRHRTAGALVRAAALVVVIGIVLTAVVAVLWGGYQIRPVLSGSMRPGLPVGGVVITHTVPVASLRVRDVIVFHRPGHPNELVVHRIIELNPSAAGPVIRTQGDANSVPDPWSVTLHGTTAYRANFSVPLVGYAAIWVHQPQTRRFALMLAILLGLTALVMQVRHLRRPKDPVDAEDPATVETSEAEGLGATAGFGTTTESTEVTAGNHRS